MPSLTDLDKGEPKMSTDFRSIYAALLTDWMNLPADGGDAKLRPTPLFQE